MRVLQVATRATGQQTPDESDTPTPNEEGKVVASERADPGKGHGMMSCGEGGVDHDQHCLPTGLRYAYARPVGSGTPINSTAGRIPFVLSCPVPSPTSDHHSSDPLLSARQGTCRHTRDRGLLDSFYYPALHWMHSCFPFRVPESRCGLRVPRPPPPPPPRVACFFAEFSGPNCSNPFDWHFVLYYKQHKHFGRFFC